MSIGRLLGIIFLSALCVGLNACSKSKTVTVTVSGSSTVLPIVSIAAEKYQAQMSDVQIIVNAGGSGVGLKQLGEGQTDLGMMSRDITEGEIARFAETPFKVHVVGIDAVVPAISSEIYDAGVTSLSLEQLGKIYLGEISNWSQLGGPDRDILVLDKEASRGTRQVFMSFVLRDKTALAPGADLVLGSNNEEQTALIQSDSAIGMLSHAWMNEDVKGVSIVTEAGDTIEPSLSNISTGKFPITRGLHVISRADSSAEAMAFVDYLLSEEGQQIVEEAGYIKVVK